MNPISSASAGVLSASAGFAAAGVSTLAAANGQGDLAAAIVGQAQAGVQLRAAANVAKVSDQLTATLLDITV